MISIRSILCTILYLAGGFFFARKDANATISNLSVKYPKLLPVVYDGCFFGPVSSEIEKTFEDAAKAEYFKEYYFVVRSEPTHKVRVLSEFGRLLAEKIVKNAFILEEIGLNEQQIPELSAEALCFNTLPTSFGVMNTLYLQNIRKEENLLSYLKKPPVKEPPFPQEIDRGIRDESIGKLTELYDRYWNWIISVKGLRRTSVSFSLPYGIVPENIKERYRYLIPERSDILKFLNRAEKSKKEKTQTDFLLKEMTVERIVPEFSSLRAKNLNALVHMYPEIPIIYTEKLIDNLGPLEKNYEEIIKYGYNHIFDDFLKPLAELSQELFKEETLQNQLHIQFKSNGDLTRFILHIPDEMRQKFGGSLNYGLGHYHLGHFPQVEQNTYFVDIGHEAYVIEAGQRLR